MRLTEMQKNLLLNLDAKTKLTSADLAEMFDTKPGPVSRSAYSLSEKGLLRYSKSKEGEVLFSRTADGGKVAKTIA